MSSRFQPLRPSASELIQALWTLVVPADRSLHCSFCRYVKPEDLGPLSLRIIGDLGPYLAQATEETLALVLEAIRSIIGVDGSVLDQNSTEQLVSAILQVWTTNASGESQT